MATRDPKRTNDTRGQIPPERDATEVKPGSERSHLVEDPNYNQAGNDRGSADNTSGSQTGADIDLIPEP
jgi:hypothetical protein